MRYSLRALLLLTILASIPLAIYAHRQYQLQLHWQPFNARRFDAALDAGRDVLVLIGKKPESPWIPQAYDGYSTFSFSRKASVSIERQIDTPEFCKFVNRKRIAMFYLERKSIDMAIAEKLYLPPFDTGELVEHVAIYLPTARKHQIVLYNPNQSELIEMLSLAYKKPMQPSNGR